MRLRQPLQSVTIGGLDPLPDELSQLIADELNVREVIYKRGNVRYKAKHPYYDKRG